jgi:hypothetical protein
MASATKAEVDKITGAVEDAVAYPILTKDVGSSPSGSSSSGGTGPGGTLSLDVVAKNSIWQAMGWRYRTDDTKGFVAALKKVFLLREVEGTTVWDYRPQSYTVQADMGEITGAQASIFARAKNAIEQTQPLLDGLTALKADPDLEGIEAMRSIVRDELNQLVGELGQTAGPRVQRVDSIFKLLIGPKAHYANPVKVLGHLGQLGDRLGMDRRLVNTIEDEQDLTNFLILVDYVNSLYQTWDTQRDFFSRGKHGQPFLGTQLVLISQALAAVADQVQDTIDALESVYLGQAERQTIMLNFFGEFAPITLAELLGWVLDFTTNEGPQLLQESGKDGVVAFRATINRLEYLMFLTSKLARSGGRNPARGFHTFRAQVALGDLLSGLHTVDRESSKIWRSDIDDSLALTQALNQPTIKGARWEAGGLLAVEGSRIKAGSRVLLVSVKNPSEGRDAVLISPAKAAALEFAEDEASILLHGEFRRGHHRHAPYTVVVVSPDGVYAWWDEVEAP